ncbi:MAG: helix-turn-helix domain-containing protein [Lentisphaerae bacterium]|nr:helix-turn-helix domain-containing protein [Lentisphaerota bacterium]
MKEDHPLDLFLKRLIVAPKAKQAVALESALALLNGKPEDRLLYNGAEAARMLSISTQTLWRMVHAGTITPVKVRGSTRYRRTDLERLAAGEVTQ